MLTVSDTGIGMTPEVKERIFDPYFTTKGKSEGTGLGLSVVQGIIKSHGGAIEVNSTAGKGSTFSVYLPLIQKEDSKSEKEEAEALPTGIEHILFIDDEESLASLGKEMLEHLGYQVTEKTSSIEAFELFRTKPDQFDLVITDMAMPHMGGDKLAEELMKIRPDIPIIICTEFSKQMDEDKAKKMNIKSLLMKPIMMQDLATSVRQAFDET